MGILFLQELFCIVGKKICSQFLKLVRNIIVLMMAKLGFPVILSYKLIKSSILWNLRKNILYSFSNILKSQRNAIGYSQRRSDKFIITHKGENDELGVYVRTKQGGWFGCGDWFNSAILDVTGENWQNMLNNMAKYQTYTEEIENIVKENTI